MVIDSGLFDSLIIHSNQYLNSRCHLSLSNVHKGLILRDLLINVIRGYDLSDAERDCLMGLERKIARVARITTGAKIFYKLFGNSNQKIQIKDIQHKLKACNATILKINRALEMGLNLTDASKMDAFLFDKDHVYHQLNYFGLTTPIKGCLELPLLEITELKEELIEGTDEEQLKKTFNKLCKKRAKIEIAHFERGRRNERIPMDQISLQQFTNLINGKGLSGEKVDMEAISIIKPEKRKKIRPLSDYIQEGMEADQTLLIQLFDRLQKGNGIVNKGKGGDVESISAQDLTFGDFKKLILDVEGKPHSDIVLSFKDEFYNFKELIELNVLGKVKKGQHSLSSGYQLTQDGIVNNSSIYWKTLKPIMHVKDAPKQPVVEIVTHFRQKEKAGFFFGQPGHVSIKITDTDGAVYSVGILAEGIENLTNFSLRDAFLLSPDPFLLKPANSYRSYSIRYTLPEKGLHKVMNWIEAMKGFKDLDLEEFVEGENKYTNFLYHPLYQNCAHFGFSVQDICLQNGAKPVFKAKLPLRDRLNFKIEKVALKLINKIPFFRKLSNTEKGNFKIAGIENFNIKDLNTHQMLFPVDLFRGKSPIA